MEFFDGWKTLNTRFDSGDLTALTQLVGYKIFRIFDEHRFPDSLPISDRELMSRTNIQSARTIVEARRRLKNAGLIDFDTSHGITRYRLIQVSNREAVSKQLVSSEEAAEADSYIRARDPYTPKPTYKTTTTTTAHACEKAQEYWVKIHGGRLTFEHLSEIQSLIEAHGLDWVINAMKEASDVYGGQYGVNMKLFRSVVKKILQPKGGGELDNCHYERPTRTGKEPWAEY